MEDTNRETVLVDVDMGDGGVTNDELERVEVELREGGVNNDELERVEVEVREGVGNGEEDIEEVVARALGVDDIVGVTINPQFHDSLVWVPLGMFITTASTEVPTSITRVDHNNVPLEANNCTSALPIRFVQQPLSGNIFRISRLPPEIEMRTQGSKSPTEVLIRLLHKPPNTELHPVPELYIELIEQG